jgi:hypothetical protein
LASVVEASKDSEEAASICTSTISPSWIAVLVLRYPEKPGLHRLSAVANPGDNRGIIKHPNKKPILNIFIQVLLRLLSVGCEDR